MSLMLNENQSFSLTANVTSPGYIRTVLKGYLVSKRNDGTYIAPLLPQLFYGADGQPLTTWRQNITTAGSQVILSRSGGLPTLPREELDWRKVREEEPVKESTEVSTSPLTLLEQFNALPWYIKILVILGIASAAAGAVYVVTKAFKR